jgi:hypothetical protein
LVLALGVVSPVSAQESEHTATIAPNHASVEPRIVALTAAFDDIQTPTRLYYWSWMTVMSVGLVGQAAYALWIDKPSWAASAWIGVGLCAASITMQLLTPFPALNASSELAAMPERTEEERRRKILRGQRLLEIEAESTAMQIGRAHV